MPLPDQQFLTSLTSGAILPSHAYWPQLEAILRPEKNQLFSVRNTSELWHRAARWMYRNPDKAWAPETEQLFRMDFGTNMFEEHSQNRLLQTWLRFGTHTPNKEDQALIASGLQNAKGLQCLQFAFNAAAWVSAEQRAKWLEQSQVEVQRRPTPTPESMYVYLHGDKSLLCPAQKKDANEHLCGEMEDYPISFPCARKIAELHPEPEVWTAHIMSLAWGLSTHLDRNDMWPSACKSIGHLDAMLDAMPWRACTPENTLCLVTAALMQREGNVLGLDMSAWPHRSPVVWELTKNVLPILESLHNIPMGPFNTADVNQLVPLMFNEHQKVLLNAKAEMPIDPRVFSESSPSPT